jgi:hypothetical protein
VPQFESDTYVYDEYHLLKSYLVLADRKQIAIPDDTATLIEAVYSNEDRDIPFLATQLDKAKEKMEANRRKERTQADKRLVVLPSDKTLLKRGSSDLKEDTPDIHEAFQALTRLGPPTVSIVCLHRHGETLWTEPDGQGDEIDLSVIPDHRQTQALALHTVRLSHQGIVRHLLGTQKPPTAWLEHPLLSEHYVAIFEKEIAYIEGTEYQLRLSKELGIEIMKPGSSEEE